MARKETKDYGHTVQDEFVGAGFKIERQKCCYFWKAYPQSLAWNYPLKPMQPDLFFKIIRT